MTRDAGDDRRSRQKLAERVLSDPNLYPDDFKAWIPRWLGTNVNFQVAQGQLPAVEAMRLVGATGQPAFLNGWVNYGGSNGVASFYKDPFGRVHLSGIVKNGTVGAVIFTLPPGYRPQGAEAWTSLNNGTLGGVTVNPDGTVQHTVGASNVYLTLAGVSFRAFA